MLLKTLERQSNNGGGCWYTGGPYKPFSTRWVFLTWFDPKRPYQNIMKKLYILPLLFLTGCSANMAETLEAAASQPGYTTTASWYQKGRYTASGQRFNPNNLTAAHRSYPFGTKLKVTNISTGKYVLVTVNDRGPFIKSVGIDLSKGAATQIGIIRAGKAKVRIQKLE